MFTDTLAEYYLMRTENEYPHNISEHNCSNVKCGPYCEQSRWIKLNKDRELTKSLISKMETIKPHTQ